jgi:hypothetical protein
VICECQNCGFEDEYLNLPKAQNILKRHNIGDTFSDVECPKCGALCYEVETDDDGKITTPVECIQTGLLLLGQAREYFKAAKAPQTTERVRKAITSAGGALRHALGKQDRAKR